MRGGALNLCPDELSRLLTKALLNMVIGMDVQRPRAGAELIQLVHVAARHLYSACDQEDNYVSGIQAAVVLVKSLAEFELVRKQKATRVFTVQLEQDNDLSRAVGTLHQLGAGGELEN